MIPKTLYVPEVIEMVLGTYHHAQDVALKCLGDGHIYYCVYNKKLHDHEIYMKSDLVRIFGNHLEAEEFINLTFDGYYYNITPLTYSALIMDQKKMK
jgi:hypothetical protein